MPDDRPTGAPIPFATWLASVHEILGTAGGAELTADERDVLLDIASTTTGSVNTAHTNSRRCMPTSSSLAPSSSRGAIASSAIPQIGQAPGPSRTTSGCIGHE